MYKHPPALHLAARLPDDEPGHMWRPLAVVQRRVTALAVLVTTSNNHTGHVVLDVSVDNLFTESVGQGVPNMFHASLQVAALVLQVLYPVPEPGVV